MFENTISVHLSSKTLAHAARVAEQIEALQKQLNDLLQKGDTGLERHGEISRKAKRKVSLPKKAVPRARHGGKTQRGTLTLAVLKVLKKSNAPLKAAAIYERLAADGYQFSFKEPKKVLQIRLYKMAGVRVLGAGLFKAK